MMSLTSELLDDECLDCCDTNPNLMIPWYLMAAYAYYVEDSPILTDHMFDHLAKRMLKDWDNLTHFHKNCLDKDMLQAGTFIGEYPSRVQGGLAQLRHTYQGGDGRKPLPGADKHKRKKSKKNEKKLGEGDLQSFFE